MSLKTIMNSTGAIASIIASIICAHAWGTFGGGWLWIAGTFTMPLIAMSYFWELVR
jgi:hypothetical protein